MANLFIQSIKQINLHKNIVQVRLMESLLFYSQSDQTITSFYSDIIASVCFQSSNALLQKYNHNQLPNYSIVIFTQKFTQQIIQSIFKNNCQKLNDIKHTIKTHIEQLYHQQQNQLENFNQQQITKIINVLGSCIFNRLEEIKAKYLMDSISLGALYLTDVNWKIVKTVSSNSRSYYGQKYPYLFHISLYLNKSQKTQNSNQNTGVVSLQLNKIQLKQFLTKLKTIKSEMI